VSARPMECRKTGETGGNMFNAVHALLSAPPDGTLVSGGYTSSVSTSILPIASIVVEILALFVGVAIVGLFIIIVVANRAEPDATGHRPQSVYFFAVSFVTLVTTIVGSIVVVFSLVELIGPDSSSPSRRVAQSYVSAVSFLAVLILLVVSILTVYLLFALGGPGVFGSFGGRTSALRVLVDAVYIGFVAGTVLLTHRNLVTPGLQFFGAGNGSRGPRGGRPPRGRHASGDATSTSTSTPTGPLTAATLPPSAPPPPPQASPLSYGPPA
jgi:hypothetical protein